MAPDADSVHSDRFDAGSDTGPNADRWIEQRARPSDQYGHEDFEDQDLVASNSPCSSGLSDGSGRSAVATEDLKVTLEKLDEVIPSCASYGLSLQ